MVDKLEAVGVTQADHVAAVAIADYVTRVLLGEGHSLLRNIAVQPNGPLAHMLARHRATLPTPTEDALERTRVLEAFVAEYVRVWEAGTGTVYLIDQARAALGNKETSLSLSEADAGNPQKTTSSALGNKESEHAG